jgi:hypothetical protein
MEEILSYLVNVLWMARTTCDTPNTPNNQMMIKIVLHQALLDDYVVVLYVC